MRDPQSTERRDVVLLAGQRNPYDMAIQLAGARMIQAGNLFQTFPWEIEAAITDRTVAIFHFAGPHLATGAAALETVIDIGHAHGLPVVVDAAAQLPPRENSCGGSLSVVRTSCCSQSGKGLRGPQSSGLILGRADLIEACRIHSAPHQRLGRPMKVSKEDLVGVLVAVERFLDLDADAILEREEAIISGWVSSLGAIPHATVRGKFPGEAGTGTPACAPGSRPIARSVSGSRRR